MHKSWFQLISISFVENLMNKHLIKIPRINLYVTEICEQEMISYVPCDQSNDQRDHICKAEAHFHHQYPRP